MKKVLSIVLCTAMLLSLFVVSTSAAAWDGTTASTSLKGEGTADKPYLVETAEDLAFLAKDVNGGNKYAGKYITQTADIDLGGKEWAPIGAGTGSPFAGVYNGCGYTIKGFYQSAPLKFSGLFGYIATDGFDGGIANLTLEGKMEIKDATLTGHWSASPLVGWSFQNSATVPTNTLRIINIVTDVDITVTNYAESPRAAGVAGYAFRTEFENVVSNGDITLNGKAQGRAGGIVAESNGTNYTNCVNNGNFTVNCETGAIRTAGIVAYSSKNATERFMTLKNCVNNGDITAKVAADTTIYVAGMIASFQGGPYDLNLVFDGCLNAGDLKGTTGGTANSYAHIGGMGGYPENGNNAITVKGCVNTGAIAYEGGKQDRTSDIFGTIYSANFENILYSDCVCVGKVKSVTFSVKNPDTAITNCTENAEAAVAAAAAKKITDALAPSTTKIAGFDTAYKAPVVPDPTPTPTPNPGTGDVATLLVVMAIISLAGVVVTKKVSVR